MPLCFRYVLRRDLLSKDGLAMYCRADESGWEMLRIDGIWYIQLFHAKFYQCKQGTDSPPSDGWEDADMAPPEAGLAGLVPTVRSLNPPTNNPLFLRIALGELIALDTYRKVSALATSCFAGSIAHCTTILPLTPV